MQTICTSLQTDNHTNTSSLNFYRPDALPVQQCQNTEKVNRNQYEFTHFPCFESSCFYACFIPMYAFQTWLQYVSEGLRFVHTGCGAVWARHHAAPRGGAQSHNAFSV